jgi:hypothetical protein
MTGAQLVAGERVSAKNFGVLCEGDAVRRVNIIRKVRSVVGRYSLRLEGEDRFWDVRAPLRPVTFVSRANANPGPEQ